MEKRLDAAIGDPSAPESRVEIILETAVESIRELGDFGFQSRPLPDLRFVLQVELDPLVFDSVHPNCSLSVRR